MVTKFVDGFKPGPPRFGVLDPYWILMMFGASRGSGTNIRCDLTRGANYKISATLTRHYRHNLILNQEPELWSYAKL